MTRRKRPGPLARARKLLLVCAALACAHVLWSLGGSTLAIHYQQQANRLERDLGKQREENQRLRELVDAASGPHQISEWAAANGMVRVESLVTLPPPEPTQLQPDEPHDVYASVGAGFGL